MRHLIEHLAKRLYSRKYAQLRDRLLYEFELIKRSPNDSFDTLTKLLISGEDHRFYYHIGFDIIAILRALRNRVIYNKIEGASTIEQQLVRVLTNDYERTFQRKIQEILLATTITSLIPKSAIPKIYLNVAYYGTGMNGLNQVMARMGLTNKGSIPIDTAAEIVSRIKYPQPVKSNHKRIQQIEIRKQHLINLYKRHLSRRYFKVYG